MVANTGASRAPPVQVTAGIATAAQVMPGAGKHHYLPRVLAMYDKR
jgi:hypothetical protein